VVHCNGETAGRFLASARGVDLALRAVGGVWSACEVLWGLAAVLWAGAEERGRWKGGIIEAIFLVTCFVAV
jgi:hypothetical protein